MKKIFTFALTVALMSLNVSPALAAFTVIKNYKISLNIPESVSTEEAVNAEDIQADETQKEEQMTIMERIWRDSQILLVKTTVVK
jgi:hypothetical protein